MSYLSGEGLEFDSAQAGLKLTTDQVNLACGKGKVGSRSHQLGPPLTSLSSKVVATSASIKKLGMPAGLHAPVGRHCDQVDASCA